MKNKDYLQKLQQKEKENKKKQIKQNKFDYILKNNLESETD
jgi:hypothetical protein